MTEGARALPRNSDVIILRNERRGIGLPVLSEEPDLRPSVDASTVAALLANCPAACPTPLLDAARLAEKIGVAAVRLKDERDRMGLGSFKALGAAYAIAVDAQSAGSANSATALSGKTYVAASAGNHGLSVAAGARVFGATAVIFLAEPVPETFAGRLRSYGARVERAGATYEESMAAAATAAERNGWVLLSDSSWPGYVELPRRVMEGYLQMIAEVTRTIDLAPTHLFLQAGVGGMAAAVAASARDQWGEAPVIVVVEPDAAPALFESVRAGRIVETSGPVSSMGRLDCKVPSLLALCALARDADFFVTISETDATEAVEQLSALGLETTPSGGAGVAALLCSGSQREVLGLTRDSRVLAIVSEGPAAS